MALGSPDHIPESYPHLLRELDEIAREIGLAELEAWLRRRVIEEALRSVHGNKSAAARSLRLSRQHLQHILRALD